MDDQAPADTGSDGQRGEVSSVAAVAEPVLGLHERVQIVRDHDREPDAPGHQRVQVDVTSMEERCSLHQGKAANSTAEADPHGGRTAVDGEFTDHVRKHVSDRLRVSSSDVVRAGRQDAGTQIRQDAVGAVTTGTDRDLAGFELVLTNANRPQPTGDPTESAPWEAHVYAAP
jgi:hypothetical protein